MGSGGHFGLWIDSELLHGSSGTSATFANPCLCVPPDHTPLHGVAGCGRAAASAAPGAVDVAAAGGAGVGAG
eukprot:scaffold9534_cov90-Isochrysis_galbana.AAC.3